MNSILIMVAMTLTMEGNHEDSLKTLLFVSPNKNEVVTADFLKMSNYYALNKKAEAQKYAQRVEDAFEEVPLRYSIIAKMVLFNLENWTENDLGDIARDMRHSKERLKSAKAGKTTQVVQKVIVDKLDKLIKEKEDKEAQAKAERDAAADKIVGRNQPGDQANKPLEDAIIAMGEGKGKVDDKIIKVISESWGTMNDKQRAKVVQIITRDLPVRYRVLIESFEKAIANHNNR